MSEEKFYIKLTDKHSSDELDLESLPLNKNHHIQATKDVKEKIEKGHKGAMDCFEILNEEEYEKVQKPENNVKVETEEDKINTLPGVGAATTEKLMTTGFDNLMSISVASPGQLVEVAGVTESAARKIIYAARDKLDMGFESGEDLLKKRAQIIKLTTGCKAFDEMLAGGFESGGISECFGEFGSSKSQIAHVLAVRVQLSKEQGGADGSAIFLDGESTFRPERIVQIAKGLNLDPDEVLKNIKVARAFNSDHQMLLAEKSEEIIKEGINGLPVKLLVMDSLTSHFRADFSGRGQLADRQQKLNRHMHVLMKLANQYNLCVYVTNQVMSRPDMFFGDPTTAIGGNIVGHNSQTRIYLRKGKKGTRVGKLIDSPYLADTEAIFKITESGMEDI